MVHIILSNEVHKELGKYKIDNESKTFNDAIKSLLSQDNAINDLRKINSGRSVFWEALTDSFREDKKDVMCVELAKKYDAGGVSYQDLADEYGTYKQKVIRMVKKGRNLMSSDDSVFKINKDFVEKILDFEAKRLGYSDSEALINSNTFNDEKGALSVFLDVVSSWTNDLKEHDELIKQLNELEW